MKYTISDDNRWTTLAACVDNHLFGVYTTPFNLIRNSWMVCGEYPQSEQPTILNQVVLKINPDYKHISPEKWNSIVNDFQDDLDVWQAQDEIVSSMKEAIRRYHFGDTKKQEQELYRSIRKGLADMYEDGYNDGKYNHDKDFSGLQGRYEFMLDACMEYMRVVLKNKGVI